VVVVVAVVVGIVSVVVAQPETSGEQEPSAADPAAVTASAATRQRIDRAGRGDLGTVGNINDTVPECVARS
jgi:hypothetical protein